MKVRVSMELTGDPSYSEIDQRNSIAAIDALVYRLCLSCRFIEENSISLNTYPGEISTLGEDEGRVFNLDVMDELEFLNVFYPLFIIGAVCLEFEITEPRLNIYKWEAQLQALMSACRNTSVPVVEVVNEET